MKYLYLTSIIVAINLEVFAQVGINNTGAAPDPSTMLDLQSTAKGLLVPRMTLAQRNLISAPAASLLIFQTDGTAGYYYNSGTPGAPVWERLAGASGVLSGSGAATRVAFWDGVSSLSSNANLYWDNSLGRLGIGTGAPAYQLDVAGDVRATGDFYGDIHVDDTRAVNSPPTTYDNEVAFDFKDRSVVGVPGSGAYSGMMTIAPWGDDSGDASHQINFNEGGLFWRQGQPNSGSWDAWSQILTTSAGGGGTPNYLARWVTVNTLGIGATYDNGTNVGIGNATPGQKLDVSGNIRATGAIYANANGAAYLIGGDDATLNDVNVANTVGIIGAQNPATASVQLGNNSATYIAGTGGNIGVGTNAPSRKLEVNGDIKLAYGYQIYFGESVTSNGRIGLNFHTDGDPNYWIGKPAGVWTQPLHIGFYTGVKIGAHYSYGGTKFYNSSDMTTELMSIGNGDNHVRVNNYLFAQYLNSTDNSETANVTGVMVKSNGDNYLRTGTAAAVASFLNSSLAPSYANLTGIPTRSAWSGVHRGFVAEQLSWKNYGNNHTIFDASQGTSPDGGAINNTNSQVAWSASYPTLMGWNGANTYGVRVDVARYAESAPGDNLGNHSATTTLSMNGNLLSAAGKITFNGVGGNSGQANDGYAIYQEAGAWTHPYPDLCIGYHTGIKLGAHFSYNGTRFYNNSDFATQIFSVGDGDNFTRVCSNGGSDGIAMGQIHGDNTNTIQAYIDGHWADRSSYAGGCCNALLIQPDVGVVGIGLSNPSYTLHVNGRIKSNGINETSDVRLKKNFKPLENALEKTLRLEGVTYEWRTDEFPDMKLESGVQMGLIAQEVEKVLPWIVSTDNEGYKSMEYGHLVALLVEAIKDLNEEIKCKDQALEQYKGKLDEMQKSSDARMSELEAKISRIQSLVEPTVFKK